MLIVKVESAPSVAGGQALTLCDAQGDPLPNQVSVKLEQEVGDASSLTVRFVIDGKHIVLK